MGELGLCSIDDIQQTVQTYLLSDITTDGGLPILLTRLLHNKAVYYLFYSLRCYMLYFDVSQIMRFLSPLFLPFIIAACILPKYRKALIITVLASSLVSIMNPFGLTLSMKITLIGQNYLVVSIVGAYKLIYLLLRSDFIRKIIR